MSKQATKKVAKPKAVARPAAKAVGKIAKASAVKAAPKAKKPAKSAAPVASKVKAAKVAAKPLPPKSPAKPSTSPRTTPATSGKTQAKSGLNQQSISIEKAKSLKPITKAAEKSPEKKITARAPQAPIVLPPDYRPAEGEPFMNEMHRVYFRQKLMTWKEEIIRQTRETLAGLHEDSTQHADLADRATSETDRALELRARDRQRKLVAKIDAALARIEDGTYGYCEETGEPIGLKRLDARPIATLSLEAQERHERREKVYRED